MMQKLWQKKQKLSYSKDVVDIVQFGSSMMEESAPRDIDVAVFFKKIPLKEQLEQAQKVKKQLVVKFEIPVHIKSYDFYSFFEASNFARDGIMFYGKSILSGRNFVDRFGLEPKLQILYSLQKLEKKDKIRFNYLLNGKKGSYGLLKRYGGKLIRPGMVEIAPELENVFLEKMKKITSRLEVRKIFVAV